MMDSNSHEELILEEESGVTHYFYQFSRTHSFCTPRRIIIASVLLFVSGILVGVFAYANIDRIAQNCTETSSSDDTDEDGTVQTETFSDWSHLITLFKNTLTTSSIENTLSQFSSDRHEAGSAGDEELGEKVVKRFRDYGMNHWIDEHFINVQERPSSGANTVTFRGTEFNESGYLVYSATGAAKGTVLYAYYGQVGDFRQLQALNINLDGRIVLVRAGKISFAEKVANAASVNASAVLIYADPADYAYDAGTDLFGHVHLGCGDPYTPGFPSFNHTQFSPAKSSGLPSIPAQTIKASTAAAIMRQMEGPDSPPDWSAGGLQGVKYKLGSDNDLASVEIHNVLTVKKVHNVFGVIRGVQDPDRYVVIGAQRDAWGPGYAKSTVGTSLLVELARTFTDMMRKRFMPRRSMVFASWSAGEYGSVGATEWLEGYLNSINMKAFSYISLDGVVTGSSFKASASPLLYDLIESTLNEVSSPDDTSKSLYSQVTGHNWMEPMKLSDSVYPFQTFSGIPSVSFYFTSDKEYPFFGTMLDTRKNLENKISIKLPLLIKTAGEIAGQMALRLVHDHLLRLNVGKYSSFIRDNIVQINREVIRLQTSGHLSETLNMQWLISALGSYSRATSKLTKSIQNTNLGDLEQCRNINDRIMRVEKDFLSPYVSPLENPFRHVLLGSGSHTLGALRDHLAAINEGRSRPDILLRNQLAMITWTIQSCANALAGSMWEMDNEV